MKTEIQRTWIMTLQLSEVEARWLHGLLQNPINCAP